MTAAETNAAAEAVIRIESARLIAGLAHYTGDVGLAEELAQDAVVAALEQWPETGVPRNPGGWLMTVAKRRAIDLYRRNERLRDRYRDIGRDLALDAEAVDPDFDRAVSDDIDDDLLRLVFTACHPVLSMPARVALTLRLLGGLTTVEIARAHLVPESTIAQRIVRAKKTLASEGVPFEVPEPADRPARLSSVLEVVYLIFNEGYSATAGGDWMRPALCADALRLGRLLAELVADEPEVHGLLALMEIQASRLAARTDADGRPILLLDQDRLQWDRLLITRGLQALARAEELARDRASERAAAEDADGAVATVGGAPGVDGPYALQAAIAACHARAARAEDTNWRQIALLYDVLALTTPSPVVQLNRAVAVSMAFGPQAGLDLVDELAEEPSLRAYHLLPSVRADLLVKVGRHDEARAEFERAADLTDNERERELSMERARDAARQAEELDGPG